MRAPLVLALAVLAGCGAVVTPTASVPTRSGPPPTLAPVSGQPGVVEILTPPTNVPAPEGVVLLTDTGFSPELGVVNPGTKIIFRNTSKRDIWPVAADLEKLPAFDPKAAIKPGAEWSFVIDELGMWAYRDKLKEDVTGRIRVVPKG